MTKDTVLDGKTTDTDKFVQVLPYGGSIELVSHLGLTSFACGDYQVVVIGDLRPYNQGFFADTAAQVNWLTKLLSEPWTPSSLYPQLSGRFVLLIMQQQTGAISVFNDHLAMVPLYWQYQRQTLKLATRLTAIKSADSQLDPQSIYNYFFFHCVPAPYTIYQGVQKMPPGAALRLDNKQQPHIDVVFRPQYHKATEADNELQQQCFDTIEQAVGRYANNKVGAFLSGGLDSSTVAGMLAQHREQAQTFSIGFHAKGYDETEYAEITARHFNTQHQTRYLGQQDILDNFQRIASFYDEPFGNSSALAVYMCAITAKENAVNALLAGDGGDELFAGNSRYAKQKIFALYDKLPRLVQGVANGLFDNAMMANIPGIAKLSSYVRQARVGMPARMYTYNFLNRFDVQQIFTAEFLAQVDVTVPQQLSAERYNECLADDPTEKQLYLDWKFTLADNDLVKVNKMCELAEVDVAYPLLEKEVVNFACKVPAEIKLPSNKLRDFYKRTFAAFLSAKTITKSKHGFGLPFGVWMVEDQQLRQMSEDYLASFKTRKIFNPEFIDKAMAIYQSGVKGYYGELIWIMLVFEAWLQGNEDN